MPYCPSCGLSNTSAGRCTSCSSFVPTATQYSPQQQHPRERRDRSKDVIIIIGLIAIAVFAVNQREKSTSTVSPAHDNESRNVTYLPSYQTAPTHTTMRKVMNGGSNCAAGDFTIKGLTGTDDYGYARIVGIIVNNCSEPAGVEIKTTLYNASGDVVNTSDSWPASISNISPHVPFPFKTMLSSESGWKKYNVVAIEAKRW